jgi:enoyl-CoA hydratase/carnithine racemase
MTQDIPTDMGRGPVRLDMTDGIATLVLDHPANLNAASAAMMAALDRRLAQLEAMQGLRVVILTGAGRAFCAGGDLIEFRAALAAGGSRLTDTLLYNQTVIDRIEALPVPVIGVANGIAVAGGLELLLACDMTLAADSARLGDGHARYGVLPAGGATVRLVERIGPARAAQLFYTADLIDAATALSWGLVNEVWPLADLMPRAQALAVAMARCSPEVLRRTKRMTAAEWRYPDRQARLRAEIAGFAMHQKGHDLRDGLEAFAAKAMPVYRDPDSG